MYFALTLTRGNNFRTAFSAVERYKEEWPQAKVRPAGITHEGPLTRVVFEIDMGEMRRALKGESPEVQAGYGFLFTVSKNLFHLRPALVSAPTAEERALIDSLYEPPNQKRNTKLAKSTDTNAKDAS